MKTSRTQLLLATTTNMHKALLALERSWRICSTIKPNMDMPDEIQDDLEALTSRFARASDLMMQKLWRLIDIVELEDIGSALDRINRSEKRGIVADAEPIKEIRMVRNEIAHEYQDDHLLALFQDVLRLCPILMEAMKASITYVEQRFLGEEHE